jgi:8-oxo-dGTP pyrophosphatase MutT (NUDIX family)
MTGTSRAGAPVSRLERIATSIRGHTPVYAERDEPYWEAAVALVLRELNGGPLEVLFIQRAVREGDPWSGQIGFPGGKRDKNESDLSATVLRETREELGIDLKADGELIGALDELRPRTPVLPPVIVRPYVARLDADAVFAPSDEVAGHFWAPADELFKPGNTRSTRVMARNAFWMWHDAIHYNGHVIWGMTERILRQFNKVAIQTGAAK